MIAKVEWSTLLKAAEQVRGRFNPCMFLEQQACDLSVSNIANQTSASS